MIFLSWLLLYPTFLLNEGHDQANPLFHELRDPGLAVGMNIREPLPAPSMADGLDAKAQQAVIRAVADEDYAVAELLRKSVVAPHVLRLRNIAPSDPKAPARGVDVWFIAYGDLKAVADKEFLDRLLQANRNEGMGRDLKAADLARRHLTLQPAQATREGYAHVTFAFLDRVQISATGHSSWSQTADSVLAAALIDPRFRNDPQFPNRWRAITRADGGTLQLGPPQPYEGAAYYVKITRLIEPHGALFAEAHLIFTEPMKWFDGANLLRSKVPPVVQAQVRSLRRELVKASP
jgi:hypothetical protein